MLLLREPADGQIRSFLAVQHALPFSYPEVGASRQAAPTGYPINHYRARLGQGRATFVRARDGIQQWKMYDLPWTRLYWPATPIRTGATVVVLTRHGGLRSLNASRIIYVIQERGAVQRYGFALGTLPGHMEQGEERFTIEWHHADDSVWYELFAFARPHGLLATLGYPVVRAVQKRFATDSARAMLRTVSQ
jgi:uncharacterized protein (UPF0548 family)